MPTFSLLSAPAFLTEHLHTEAPALTAVADRMLPYRSDKIESHNFGATFSPEYFRR
jgi:hypothetical protein